MNTSWTDILFSTATAVGVVGSALAFVYKVLQNRLDELGKDLDRERERLAKVEAAEQTRSETCRLVHEQINRDKDRIDESVRGLYRKLDELKDLIIDRLPAPNSSRRQAGS